MYKFKLIITIITSICLFSCSSDDKSSSESGSALGKGIFTFKGVTYNGTCSVIPQSTEYTSANYPGFQWSMGIDDDETGEFISIGMFPQNESGTFGLSNGDLNGFNNRNGAIGLGGSELYKVKYGKIKKISTTKFTIEGVAFADLSDVPIPFTAEGNIMDLTGGFNVPDTNPYPSGKGMVSFYTTSLSGNEKLYVYLSNGNSLSGYVGEISYANEANYQCGESECFYFATPGTITYKIHNSNGIEIASGSYTVAANTCNSVQIIL